MNLVYYTRRGETSRDSVRVLVFPLAAENRHYEICWRPYHTVCIQFDARGVHNNQFIAVWLPGGALSSYSTGALIAHGKSHRQINGPQMPWYKSQKFSSNLTHIKFSLRRSFSIHTCNVFYNHQVKFQRKLSLHTWWLVRICVRKFIASALY